MGSSITTENGDGRSRLKKSLQTGFTTQRGVCTFQLPPYSCQEDVYSTSAVWRIHLMGSMGTLEIRRGKRLLQADDTEERSTQFALEPLMLAERDRIFIKQLKQNRDYEEKLMKDVKGWEVGTYYGIPIYNDVKNQYPIVPWQEYYTHSRPGGVNADEASGMVGFINQPYCFKISVRNEQVNVNSIKV